MKRLYWLVWICVVASGCSRENDHGAPRPQEEAEDSVDQDELILDEDVGEELPEYPASKEQN